MTKLRVIVCGGRDYVNRAKVWEVLNALMDEKGPLQIIEGGANGADSLARAWAAERRQSNITFHADWSKGRSAGPARNRTMLECGRPQLVIAFPGGRGTANMVNIAKVAGIEVREIEP